MARGARGGGSPRRAARASVVQLADNVGRSPLYAASDYDGGGGHLEVVQWLASNGGSVAQPADNGATPLMAAANNGRLEVMQYSGWPATAGRSPSRTPAGPPRSPLYVAAQEGHVDVVRWLAGNGGSVAQPNTGGYFPLLIAAREGHLEAVQWLASNGGSVAQPNHGGDTPLLAAAREGHLEVVQWLAGNGGSVTQQNDNWESPKGVTFSQGHDAVAAFLTAVSSWSAFKILVACRLADDAKRALRSGRLDPGAGPTSLAELVAASARPKDALWAGLPDVCPAMSRLVHDAMGHWTPSRHFLFHAGVRTSIRMVALSGNRVRDQHNVPTELWQLICSFFLRSDWEAPIA